jgi:hypothetical protein
MKDTIIWKRGKLIHFSGLCKPKGMGVRMEHFETEDPDSHKIHYQSITLTEYGATMSCDCTQQSLHTPKRVICSHLIGVILKKVSQIGVRK